MKIFLALILLLVATAANADDLYIGKEPKLSKDCLAGLTVRDWLKTDETVLVKKGTQGIIFDRVKISADGRKTLNPDSDEVGFLLIRFVYFGNPNGLYGVWLLSTCFSQ